MFAERPGVAQVVVEANARIMTARVSAGSITASISKNAAASVAWPR